MLQTGTARADSSSDGMRPMEVVSSEEEAGVVGRALKSRTVVFVCGAMLAVAGLLALGLLAPQPAPHHEPARRWTVAVNLTGDMVYAMNHSVARSRENRVWVAPGSLKLLQCLDVKKNESYAYEIVDLLGEEDASVLELKMARYHSSKPYMGFGVTSNGSEVPLDQDGVEHVPCPEAPAPSMPDGASKGTSPDLPLWESSLGLQDSPEFWSLLQQFEQRALEALESLSFVAVLSSSGGAAMPAINNMNATIRLVTDQFVEDLCRNQTADADADGSASGAGAGTQANAADGDASDADDLGPDLDDLDDLDDFDDGAFANCMLRVEGDDAGDTSARELLMPVARNAVLRTQRVAFDYLLSTPPSAAVGLNQTWNATRLAAGRLDMPVQFRVERLLSERPKEAAAAYVGFETPPDEAWLSVVATHRLSSTDIADVAAMFRDNDDQLMAGMLGYTAGSNGTSSTSSLLVVEYSSTVVIGAQTGAVLLGTTTVHYTADVEVRGDVNETFGGGLASPDGARDDVTMRWHGEGSEVRKTSGQVRHH